MRRRILTSALLLCLPLLAAGCKNISIVSPTDKGVYDTSVPEFKVSFSGGAPSSLKLEVNKQDVTSLFTVDSAGATAAGSKIQPFLVEGDNTFSALDGSSGRTVSFAVDATGPSVRITSVGTGNPFQVKGRLEDRAGVQSLSINGKAVTLSGDQFTASVSETPFIEFNATDKMSHGSRTVFARPGTTLATTTAARLNKSGLGFLITELNAFLGTLDYKSIIMGLNPLFDAGDWYASAKVDATNVTLSPPKLTLVVSPSAARSFDVRVEIANLKVYVKASGTVLGIGWSANGSVWASSAVFTGRATVNVVGEKLDVSIANLTCTLNGFGFDIAGFPDALESWFYDTVKGILEEEIRDQMAARIPPYIEQFLKDIPSSFQFAIGTAQFEFAALPSSLKTYLEGLTVQLGGWMETLTPAAVPAPLGSFYVNAGAPELDTKTPGGAAYDAGAAMSTNLMNQGLMAAYQAGLMNLTLDGNTLANVTPLGLADIQAGFVTMDLLDSLRFKIIPARPPFVSLRGTSTALAAFQMHEFKFELELQRSGTSDWLLVFGATLDMEVPFDIGVTTDNKIHISFEEVPKVKVYDVDDGGVLDINPEYVQKTLDRLLPRALPYLGDIIEDIPIPSYEGYGIRVKELWAVLPERAFVVLAGDLIKTTITDEAPAPDTYLAVEAEGYSSAGWFTQLAPQQALRGDTYTVLLAGRDPQDVGLEYSYRLDGGPWTVFKQRDSIVLKSLLGGTHTLEVRSRTSLLKQDPTPAKLVFATGFGEAARNVPDVPVR